jgi:alpha-beta hydrolase superfamily lysophospholipase
MKTIVAYLGIWLFAATHERGLAATASNEFRFASSDGLSIVCARWDARSSPRGVVQIAHGMGEHFGRYEDLIGALQAAGLTVYANDHRGHGRTAGSPARFGDFGPGGFNLLVEDMVRLNRIARKENPGLPIILLGHSMGSFASQQFILDHSTEIDGLVLSGSGALDSLARLAAFAPSGTNVLNAPFEPARTPFDWLSRDQAVVDAFAKDPLCFATLQPGSFASFIAAAPRLSDTNRLRAIRSNLPIYIFSGADDPVGQQLQGVKALIQRYKDAGLTEISWDFYPGGRHEMLNEINRGEVRARLLRWIDSVLQKRNGSPALETSNSRSQTATESKK